MWQPEILPMEYAIATMTKPKANDVPTKSPLVKAATPQATKTRVNVPMHSATAFF